MAKAKKAKKRKVNKYSPSFPFFLPFLTMALESTVSVMRRRFYLRISNLGLVIFGEWKQRLLFALLSFIYLVVLLQISTT